MNAMRKPIQIASHTKVCMPDTGQCHTSVCLLESVSLQSASGFCTPFLLRWGPGPPQFFQAKSFENWYFPMPEEALPLEK